MNSLSLNLNLDKYNNFTKNNDNFVNFITMVQLTDYGDVITKNKYNELHNIDIKCYSIYFGPYHDDKEYANRIYIYFSQETIVFECNGNIIEKIICEIFESYELNTSMTITYWVKNISPKIKYEIMDKMFKMLNNTLSIKGEKNYD